jgi:hypothetical protein
LVPGGTAGGAWTHTTPAGDVASGTVEQVACHRNGFFHGDFNGSATWNGAAGYTFVVSILDADTGVVADAVAPPPPETRTLRASIYDHPTRWEDGVLDVGAAGAIGVTIPRDLPVVAGNAGSGWAWMRFTRDVTGDEITCRYRGSARGTRYTLDRCTGARDACSIRAGARVDVRSLTIHVQNDASSGCHSRGGVTTVQVDMTVYPHSPPPPERPDWYSFFIVDGAENVVYETSGNLVHGEFTVASPDFGPPDAPVP